MVANQSRENDKQKGGSSPGGNKKNEKLDGRPKVDTFNNKNGLAIKTYAWEVKNPVAILFLVHGLSGNARFEYLRHNITLVGYEKAILNDADNFYIYKGSWIEEFNKKGMSVYGLDLQGHGLSEGWENLVKHVREFDDMVYDVLQFINRVHDTLCLEKYKSNLNNGENANSLHNNIINTKLPPFYIMGQSMGGNIILRLLETIGKSKDITANNNKINIRGAISLAGMISIEEILKKPSYKYFFIPFAKVLSTAFPSLRVIPPLEFKKFPYINNIFEFDKYVSLRPVTCRLAYELLRAIQNLNNDISYLPKDVPLLFVHSREDSACFFNGVQTFFNNVESNNKELFALDDMDHVLTMEPGNERILKKVTEWILNLSSSS
ncbi:lysophospholipase, putative [Plasmodium vinckei lentum]|uniref:Lysophospholipase, putative n=1 Tax=Plasmodium vinckei lentum TaxID=138297 RepID=A0A6V7SHG5_PLAVN|nr:lysophospholipase, putative [Plasmodium vinckei lentum]